MRNRVPPSLRSLSQVIYNDNDDDNTNDYKNNDEDDSDNKNKDNNNEETTTTIMKRTSTTITMTWLNKKASNSSIDKLHPWAKFMAAKLADSMGVGDLELSWKRE